MNFNELNPKQREAVKTIGGPILILAGAGSGKTRVLTHKIAYLIEEMGLLPENILAVTFTNKAAQEMKDRVQQLLSINTQSMNVGTFHSICARMLRSEIQLLGYTNDFGIYDQTDSKSLIKEVIQNMNLDTKQFDPNSIQYKISNNKNYMLSPKNISDIAEGYLDEKLALIYREYQNTLKKNNALDFDDLLLLPLQLFKEHPQRLAFYQDMFKYVLVDEYQDTNRPQFELVHSISFNHRDICVVGDDDQSIYGWRGADVKNILQFSDSFGDATIVKLEQNYRSTKIVLEAAHAIVSQNENRTPKELWTENNKGETITLKECIDERDEARQVIEGIRYEKKKNSRQLSEQVVLYRTNAQSRALEDELRRQAIPYQIIGGVKFYDRKEVKDVLAYLRLTVNPSDSVSFVRIVNFPPRGLGKMTINKLKILAFEKDINLITALDFVDELNIGKKQKKGLADFREMVKKFTSAIENKKANEISQDLINEIELHEFYQSQNSIEGKDRWQNVEELLNSIVDFNDKNKNGKLREFLEEVSLLTDIDKYNSSDDNISLMTIHSAKGLEYPVVNITGLEEGLFPIGSYDDEHDLEEERRLFYVAVTRAEHKVYLYFANARRRYGGDPILTLKSQFIHAIPEHLLDIPRHQSRQIKYKPSLQNKDKSYFHIKRHINVGDIVQHKIFGKGQIINIDGEGDNAKINILFSGNVRKKFIRKFANLTILESA